MPYGVGVRVPLSAPTCANGREVLGRFFVRSAPPGEPAPIFIYIWCRMRIPLTGPGLRRQGASAARMFGKDRAGRIRTEPAAPGRSRMPAGCRVFGFFARYFNQLAGFLMVGPVRNRYFCIAIVCSRTAAERTDGAACVLHGGPERAGSEAPGAVGRKTNGQRISRHSVPGSSGRRTPDQN